MNSKTLSYRGQARPLLFSQRIDQIAEIKRLITKIRGLLRERLPIAQIIIEPSGTWDQCVVSLFVFVEGPAQK